MRRVSISLAALVLACFISTLHQPVEAGSHTSAFESAQMKIERLRHHAAAPTTTRLTATEINAYLNEGGVRLPAGVHGVNVSTKPETVTAKARVDFDRLDLRGSGPSMLMLLSGTHDVVLVAQANSSHGLCSVRVESVEIDGFRVPRRTMQFLADHYLRPRYGERFGLDTTFALPARIDTAVVGENQVSIAQR